MVQDAGPEAEPGDDPERRLQRLLERLGPQWDPERLDSVPLDDDLLYEAEDHLPSLDDKRRPFQPTGGWSSYLLPFVGVALITLAVFAMGANLLDAPTGSLLAAGGFLLIILAALGRGKRVEQAKKRRRAEEILLLYGLEPGATRQQLHAQADLLREAKQLLEETRRR